MKKIAAERRKQSDASLRLRGRAIESVSNNRMAESGEMNANLMRASSVEIRFQKSVTGQAHADAPVGARGAAFATASGHADAAMQIAGDSQLDTACIVFQPAVEKGDVGLADLAITKLIGERAMDFVISRHQKRAGCFAVEAMHNSRTQFPADRRKFATRAEFVQQGVDYGAGFHSRARMNDHARGLVDDDEVFIRIEDFERDGLRLRVHGRRRRNFDGDCIASLDAMGALGWRAIHARVTVVEQGLDARAAEIRKMGRQETIEALAGVFGGNDELGGARKIAREILLVTGLVASSIAVSVKSVVRGFVNRGAF